MKSNKRNWIIISSVILLVIIFLFAIGTLVFFGLKSEIIRPPVATKFLPEQIAVQPGLTGTLIVGGDDSYPPYSYLEDGIAKGFDNDLMRAVGEIMGVKVEFKLTSWTEAKQNLLDGEVDVLSGMAYTSIRDEQYDYANPHSAHYSDVFVRRGSKFRALGDLQEIVVQAGDVNEDFLESSGFSGTIITLENPEEALRRVSNGEFDGALVNTIIGYYYIEANHLNNLKELGLHLLERNYGFAVREGNDQLVRQLNEALAVVEANGQYEQLTRYWFSAFQQTSYIDQLHLYFSGLVALGALLGLVILWVWSLRRQVNERTKKLRESEALYKQLIDSATEGVYVVVGGRLVYLNPQALEILKIGGMPAYPLDLRQFIHPDDYKEVIRHFKPENLANGQTVQVIHRVLLQTGEVRWVRTKGREIIWQSGSGMLGFFTDITDAKILEESVRESEKRFRLLFEKTPAGLFYYNSDLVITNINDQLVEILSVNKKALENFDFHNLKDKRIFPAISAIKNLEEGYYEGWYHPQTSKLKSDLFIKLRTTPIINERQELEGGIGVIENITGLVMRDAKLQDLEDRFKKAFLTSPDAININRLKDGLYYEVNRGFTDLSGYSHEDVKGKTSLDIEIWADPKDREHLKNELIARGEVKNFEAKFRLKDGTIKTGLMSASLIEIDGEPCIISFTRDISDRKKAEDTIRASEIRYRTIFQSVPVAIWEQDCTKVYDMFEDLRRSGVTDLNQYLNANPEFIWAALKSITVTDVNEISLAMYEAQSKDDLLGSLDKVFDRDTYLYFKNELIAMWDQEGIFEGDTINRTLDGKRIIVHIRFNIPETRDGFSSMLVSIADITHQKEAEAALRESENRYKSIFDSVPVCIWDEDFSNVFNFLQDLRENGIKDLDLYLRQHPQAVREAASLIIVNEVNDAAVAMYGAKSKAELMQNHNRVFTESSYDNFRRELIAIWNKQPKFYGETVNRTLDGRDIIISISTNIPADSEGYSRVFVSVEDITERKKAEDQIRRQVKHLASLRAVDMAISASIDLPITLRVLINQAVQQLSVDAASILLYNPKTQLLEYAAGSGFSTHAIENTRLRLGESYAGKAALERKMVAASDLATPFSKFRTANLHLEGFTDYLGIPLIAKGVVKGVLELFSRTPLPTDTEWMSFLDSMAGQAAIAIDNATLFDEVQQANINLRRAYDATIEGWARALELRDGETEGHSARVADMTVQLAAAFDIKDDEMVNIRRGALLHDIGKMGIPDHILLKQGTLTDDEWTIMRRHPVYARQLLGSIEFLQDAIAIPYSHHEKWDGSGYPEGLQGEEIPLAGRIFAVVDCWDALRSDRPYRKAWSDKDTWEYINMNAGKEYDPKVVHKFHELLVSMNLLKKEN